MLQELRQQLQAFSVQEAQLDALLLEKGQKARDMKKRTAEILHDVLRLQGQTVIIASKRREMEETLAIASSIEEHAIILANLSKVENAESVEQRRILDAIRDVQRRDATEATQFANLYKALAAAADTIGKFAFQCHQLRDVAEERVGAAALTIPSILDDIFHDRELVIRDVCNMTEFRSEESDRLDHDIIILEKRGEQEMLREIASAQQVEADLIRAFEYEKVLLRKEHVRHKDQEKELSFHAKRGTLSKRTTQLTPVEEALQSKVQQLSEKVGLLRNTAQDIEAEIVLVERQASAALAEITEKRRVRQETLSSVHDEHMKYRTFLRDLREEHEQWIALRTEMSRCICDVGSMH